jgi:hypothetical protein
VTIGEAAERWASTWERAWNERDVDADGLVRAQWDTWNQASGSVDPPAWPLGSR